MRSLTLVLAAAALLSPAARAGMIGTDTITWYYPNTSTVLGTDTLAVGSSLSCPGSSPLCHFGEPATFTLTSTTISLSEDCCTSWNSAAFNGFVFSNISFADGGSIGGVSLSTSNFPLSSSDVTFTATSISIDLAGTPSGSGSSPGVFTLTVTEKTATPEPATWLLLPAGLLAIASVRRFPARRPADSAANDRV